MRPEAEVMAAASLVAAATEVTLGGSNVVVCDWDTASLMQLDPVAPSAPRFARRHPREREQRKIGTAPSGFEPGGRVRTARSELHDPSNHARTLKQCSTA